MEEDIYGEIIATLKIAAWDSPLVSRVFEPFDDTEWFVIEDKNGKQYMVQLEECEGEKSDA